MFPIREKRFDYVEVGLGDLAKRLGDFVKKKGTGAAGGTDTEKQIGKAVKGFVTGLFKRNSKKKAAKSREKLKRTLSTKNPPKKS